MSRFTRWLVCIAVGLGVLGLTWVVGYKWWGLTGTDAVTLAGILVAVIMAPLAWWAGREPSTPGGPPIVDADYMPISGSAHIGGQGSTFNITYNDAGVGVESAPASPENEDVTSDAKNSDPAVETVLLWWACGEQAAAADFALETYGTRERRLALVTRNQENLSGTLRRHADALRALVSESTVRRMNVFTSDVMPTYCMYYRDLLRTLRQGDQESETFRRERKRVKFRFHVELDNLTAELQKNQKLADALEEMSRLNEQWRRFGFRDAREMTEYLHPSMSSLPEPIDPMSRLVLTEVLQSEAVGHVDLSRKGAPDELVEELLNRLLESSWAVVTEDDKFKLTDYGRSLLAEKLA